MIRLPATLLLLGSLFPVTALAYPSFVGFGYTSCTTCHYNPLGNGPLTDYGRALGATTISGKPFWADKVEDDRLAEQSQFLGTLVKLPPWFRPEFNYRGLHLVTGLESTTVTRWINMQAEGSITLIPVENKVWLSGTFGYAPVPRTVAPETRGQVSTWISRELYVAYKPASAVDFEAGFFDPAFGLRVPDHNAFIRSQTDLNINDQSHGIQVHAGGKKWEGALQYLLGNLYQKTEFHQKGAAGILECDIADKWRLGISGLSTSNDFRARQLGALQTRAGFGEGSSVMAQLTLIREAPKSAVAKLGDAIFLQSMTRMARGVYVLMTLEHYTDDLSGQATRIYRAGPSVQYFPFQRLELRIDLLGSRIQGVTATSPDTFTLQSQVHVWL